jgi:endoglucanase
MATAFKGYSNVVFALNNEPHDQSAAAWETIEQAVITGIRSTGATQEILASGVGWDGGESWVGDGNDVLSELSDPLKKTVIEVHQYLDPGNSGTSCTIASQAAADLSGVTAWAAGAGLKLWLGEIGVCSDTTGLAALMATMGYLNTNSNVWQGMTYWAGGPWMDAYMYSADASSAGVASAQAAALLAAWK